MLEDSEAGAFSRDDTRPLHAEGMAGAVVIPFPVRPTAKKAEPSAPPVTAQTVTSLLDLLTATLAPEAAAHVPTYFAAIGALAGFSAQQSLLIAGGSGWVQPARSGHLDRILMSETPSDLSLWHLLDASARSMGVQHLPDPERLLHATVRCIGTTQLGRITLPLEYKLAVQPQDCLDTVWTAVRDGLMAQKLGRQSWPAAFSSAAARCLVRDSRRLPPHVGVRILMQSALAMALIDPRLIRGAATKPGQPL